MIPAEVFEKTGYLSCAIHGMMVEKEEINLVSSLPCKIYPDGDAWCVLFGDNIQEGVCGFDKTPMEAVYDFNRNWYTQKLLTNEVSNG